MQVCRNHVRIYWYICSIAIYACICDVGLSEPKRRPTARSLISGFDIYIYIAQFWTIFRGLREFKMMFSGVDAVFKWAQKLSSCTLLWKHHRFKLETLIFWVENIKHTLRLSNSLRTGSHGPWKVRFLKHDDDLPSYCMFNGDFQVCYVQEPEVSSQSHYIQL